MKDPMERHRDTIERLFEQLNKGGSMVLAPEEIRLIVTIFQNMTRHIENLEGYVMRVHEVGEGILDEAITLAQAVVANQDGVREVAEAFLDMWEDGNYQPDDPEDLDGVEPTG